MTTDHERPNVVVDEASTTASSRRVWWLVAALGVVVATIGVMVAITWIAIDGAQETEARLDTASAAAALLATGDPAGAAAECPAGNDVLADLESALGPGAWSGLVADGELSVTGDQALLRCTAVAPDGDLGLVLSAAPAEALAALGADGWERLGASRGGGYSGRCGGDECLVVWDDGVLLVGLSGVGPAFEGIERERVQTALAAALPSVVAGVSRGAG